MTLKPRRGTRDDYRPDEPISGPFTAYLGAVFALIGEDHDPEDAARILRETDPFLVQ